MKQTIRTTTPSEFEEKCITDITRCIQLPIECPYIKTERNIRIRFIPSGGIRVKKLNTCGRVATAELLTIHGIIDGFTDLGNDEVYMYVFNNIETSGSRFSGITVKTTVRWEDIDLNLAQVERIAALYEYQETALKMGLLRRICVDLFREERDTISIAA